MGWKLHGFKERKNGGRQRAREFRGGTWGDQRGISESIPCWTVWELVPVSGHENKHRQMWCRVWFTCKAYVAHSHIDHYHRRKYKNKCSQHAVFQGNVSFFFSDLLPSISFPSFIPHKPYCSSPRCLWSKIPDSTVGYAFLAWVAPVGITSHLRQHLHFSWATQDFNAAGTCWVTSLFLNCGVLFYSRSVSYLIFSFLEERRYEHIKSVAVIALERSRLLFPAVVKWR